jgi:hypothetical protein
MSAPQPLMHPVPSHFSGKLVEKDLGDTLGLHQLSLRFIDEAAASHIVYIAHGRGQQAQRWAEAQFNDLEIGQHYFGRSNVCRPGVLHTYWLGDVSLALDKRRQPPAPLAALRRAGIEVVR